MVIIGPQYQITCSRFVVSIKVRHIDSTIISTVLCGRRA